MAFLIKTIVNAVILWFVYEVGRCSAIHEYCDFKHRRVNELSHDIVSFLEDYDKE